LKKELWNTNPEVINFDKGQILGGRALSVRLLLLNSINTAIKNVLIKVDLAFSPLLKFKSSPLPPKTSGLRGR
jgi:hypothetical protein